MDDEVKTLFVSGLPDDVKEREIYNLFRVHNGYDFCQLKQTGRSYQMVAFVVYRDQASALTAKEALDGIMFDPETKTTLNVELARSNSRAKHFHSEEGDFSAPEKRHRGSLDLSGFRSESGIGGTLHMNGMMHSLHNDMGAFPPSQSLIGNSNPYGMVQDGLSPVMLGKSLVPLSSGSNAPCSTLFIGNLGQQCNQEELMSVLYRFPGFRRIKMQMKAGFPVAFVEFQDVLCSTEALNQLQDIVLPSSDRGGMRIEYAKAKMGLPKRDRRR